MDEDTSQLLLVESVSFDGGSIALISGQTLQPDGTPFDHETPTTIGADWRMAEDIASALQAHIDNPDEHEQPVAQYEPWAVLA